MIIRFALAVACFFMAHPLTAAETLVKDVAEFDAAMKAAKPGDEIVLADGEWRDAKLVIRGEAERKAPITVRAQTPGRVVFTGAATLRIGGEHLKVRDLLWRDCEAENEVIAFRIDSKTLAYSSSLENCAVIGDKPTKGDRKWVSMYGAFNYVKNCRFEGKQSAGTLLVVWLEEREGPSSSVIEYNFFGPRERLGKNGGEIIRIGDSKTSMRRSGSYVTCNYFYRCGGEAEIVSNKSCENTYVGNWFVGCGGALTLRHGNSCRVSGNSFFGDGRKGTGGVRVIGEDHYVGRNVFCELQGDDARSAVSLMNGIADSPLNGYFQVQNARLVENTFLRCKQSITVGLSDDDRDNQTLPPIGCEITRNVVIIDGGKVFFSHAKADLRHEENRYHGGELGIDANPGWSLMAADPRTNPDQFEIPTIKSEPTRLEMQPGLRSHHSQCGPAWMRPGDEYLPAVLKAHAQIPAK